MNLAFRLARREMRSGLGGFRLFIACLALGVAAIAAILSFSRAVEEGLRQIEERPAMRSRHAGIEHGVERRQDHTASRSPPLAPAAG